MASAAQPPLPRDSIEIVLAGVTAIAFLATAIVALLRRTRSPLALDVGLMCVTMFAYNLLEVAYSLTENAAWAWLEYAVAACCAIPTLRLFVGYVGQSRRLRIPLAAATAYFGCIAAVSLVPFARPDMGGVPGGAAWAIAMLAGVVPTFGFSGWLLVRHARQSPPDERARTRLLLGALLLGVGGVATDLVAISGGTAPRLSAPGLVVAATLVAALVLRARLFERVSAVTLVTAALAAGLAVLAQVAVVTLSGPSTAFLVIGTVVVVLALAAGLRPLWSTLSEQRARNTYLATLGRFAQQMAHDLRNPLSAIHGAAQYLIEEQRQGRAIDGEYLALILDRAERLERVITDYQRMGRVEPRCESADLNALVTTVIDGHRVSASKGVRLEAELDEALPRCSVDRDLVAHALENVVRNALEAMGEEGALVASTHRNGKHVCIRVRDTGPGMDPRDAERAFDEFFTTKASGSGLGLAFVSRVMEAHGGAARVHSRRGEGTTVEMDLPISVA